MTTISAVEVIVDFKIKVADPLLLHFKFKAEPASLSEIFDGKVVDTSKFENDYMFLHEMKNLKWWDVNGRKLLGGQVSLPNARFMNVGVKKTEAGYVIYLMWHET